MASSKETGLASVKEKISACQVDLKAWGVTKTKPEVEAIKQLQNRLDSLNKADATDDSKAEYLEVSEKLDALLLKQEIYWAQRSRDSWFKHGDKNMKFFHSKACQRQRRNHIKGIKNAQDHWVEEVKDIAKVAVEYFDSLFCVGSCDQMEECLNTVSGKVTLKM